MSDSETAAATAQDGLDAPSTEEAPVAQVQVEEEEVAYDEEPDEEQQADGIAPASSAEAHNEVMQHVAVHRPVMYLCRQAEVLEACAEYCAVIE